MEIKNNTVFREANALLKRTYGPGASFREGQYEAIEATMTKRRTLVVQKTGWGKSLIYFISTRMNRAHGRGTTLVISPLLVLMENQMDFARNMGLCCAALNSNVKKGSGERNNIMQWLREDRIDMLFITPETLMSEEFQRILPAVRIGLLVIDEAHCISDWGHDFRKDYGELGRVISGLPSNVPVLATTATANDRVIRDLEQQLGSNVYVSRGPLTRESLHIQVLRMENKAERYAWLLDNVPRLPGTGIIYCLTKRDCDHLSAFLNQNGISCRPYYSDDKRDTENAEAIDDFYHNRIKVIIATIKLGMGYDKGDISFVIHFQSPANIVTWYQQIGRAGRNLKDAYVYLMSGKEDETIINHFIDKAFPSKEEALAIIHAIEKGNGVTLTEIMNSVNMRKNRIEYVLYFLEHERFIRKEYVGKKRYYITPVKYTYNEPHYNGIMTLRRGELKQIHELINTKECLSLYAVRALDDHTACRCGKCSNCTGRDIFPGLTTSETARNKASEFINATRIEIEPRKKWPDGKYMSYILKPGICLSKYGDPGYGEMVKKGKYPAYGSEKRFCDQLVEKSAEVLAKLIREQGIKYITFVPSLRSNIVKDFTIRLAGRTGLKYLDLLEKSDAQPQKNMDNSAFQCKNAMDSFRAKAVAMPEKVILADDMVDSRWTLAICGYKMMEKGCKEVYPFALADSSHGED